jgi:adenosylmethionine-8-amino-7-oxononanoate aminotransferase
MLSARPIFTGYSYSGVDELRRYKSGKGEYLFTSDGRKILDGLAGSMNTNLGHGNEAIAEVMHSQAMGLCGLPAVGGEASEAAIELAIRLSDRVGSPGLVSTFCSSGSEATEAALAIVWKYWRELGRPAKNRIISLDGSYHGCTFGALATTGRRDEHADIGGLLPTFRLQLPSWNPQDDQEVSRALCKLLSVQSSETIGAIILEPVMGLAGMVPAPRHDFREVVRTCRANDILVIVDEALTGLGRTGRILASAWYEIEYDILLLSKGLGCGFAPIASASFRQSIADVLRRSFPTLRHGHTASGNALSARVACALFDEIDRMQVVNNALTMGEQLISQLQDSASRHAAIESVQGLGLCVGVKFTDDRVAQKVVELSFERGLRLRALGCSVLMCPPLTISSQTCCELADLAISSISEAAGTHSH